MQPFEWKPLHPVDTEEFMANRCQFHHAIQNIAALGRRYLPVEPNDGAATMTWVPGHFRLAGKWITSGETLFRNSISLPEFAMYLVDEKVAVISKFSLHGKSQRDLMVWLEEHVGRLGLRFTDLNLSPPYEIPDHASFKKGDTFEFKHPRMAQELAAYYHNSYLSLRKYKLKHQLDTNIEVWPNHFDQALPHVLRDSGDPDTSVRMLLGMSPGDEHFEKPYFYVSCWPYADTESFSKLGNGAIWFSDDWTGAILPGKMLYGKGQEVLDMFYEETTTQLAKALTY